MNTKSAARGLRAIVIATSLAALPLVGAPAAHAQSAHVLVSCPPGASGAPGWIGCCHEHDANDHGPGMMGGMMGSGWTCAWDDLWPGMMGGHGP
ncbi:MAG TPA: hypothetical protein VFQ80_11710 [Thermomicrobiales bacterium]|nr:hypothetical protein [Thermomicrobiales bacterium]